MSTEMNDIDDPVLKALKEGWMDKPRRSTEQNVALTPPDPRIDEIRDLILVLLERFNALECWFGLRK